MKIYVTTDLEGVSGVERFSQTYGSEPFRFGSMHQLTQEVNACIRGILRACPQAVIDISDGHGSGGIIKEDMDRRANYVRGREQTRPRRLAFYQYDACMFVGQHAMAGMAHAPLAHTMSSQNIVYYKMNNVYVGEFGFWAAMAGFHDVPVIFASGDDQLAAEAESLVPNITTVITKWGQGWQRAKHVPPDEVLAQIEDSAAQACRQVSKVAPVRFEPPYSWETRYIYPRQAPRNKVEGVRIDQIDAHTILYRSDEMLTLLNAM